MTADEKKIYLSRYTLFHHALERLYRQIHLYGEKPEYKKRIEEYKNAIHKMDLEIELVEEEILREILLQKYTANLSLGRIAVIMKYSRRQIERLHRKALTKFEIL